MLPPRLKAALLAIALGSLASCSATPTLPLPPPAVSLLSAPSSTGLVTVEGTAKSRAAMFLYNEDTENGTIGRADEQGLFVLVVEGQSGDTLTLWQESGTDTGERKTLVVPDK